MARTTTTHLVCFVAGGMDWQAEVEFTADHEDETLDIIWVQADCGEYAQATIESESLDQLGARSGEVWKSFRELAEIAADNDIDDIRAHHRADLQDRINEVRYQARMDWTSDL